MSITLKPKPGKFLSRTPYFLNGYEYAYTPTLLIRRKTDRPNNDDLMDYWPVEQFFTRRSGKWVALKPTGNVDAVMGVKVLGREIAPKIWNRIRRLESLEFFDDGRREDYFVLRFRFDGGEGVIAGRARGKVQP